MLLAQLRHAVARAVHGVTHDIGVLTGGGLDSGALLVLARERHHHVHALAMDFDGPGTDRPYLAKLAAALRITPERVAADGAAYELGAEAAGLPLTWPSGALEATLLARGRALGAEVVLCGAFADACFDGEPEAASLLVRREGLLRAIAFGRAYDDAALRQGLRRALWPHVRRFVPGLARRSVALARRTLRPPTRAFDGPRLAEARAHAWERAREHEPAIERDTRTRLELAFLSQELALAAELRAQQEALANVSRSDPYLDLELVTFALSLSPELLLGQGQRRGLFRRALRGVVPEDLRTRSDKASFAPLHRALLGQSAAASCRFSALADLGIVRPREAAAAVAAARVESSAHDGELLSLIATDAWLSRGSS
jgi:asparagine synthase (glutamine-hydrolysing)